MLNIHIATVVLQISPFSFSEFGLTTTISLENKKKKKQNEWLVPQIVNKNKNPVTNTDMQKLYVVTGWVN